MIHDFRFFQYALPTSSSVWLPAYPSKGKRPQANFAAASSAAPWVGWVIETVPQLAIESRWKTVKNMETELLKWVSLRLGKIGNICETYFPNFQTNVILDILGFQMLTQL